MSLRLAPVLALMLIVAACSGGATPPSPTTTSSGVSPAGSWSGSISDAISGDGTMELALSEQAPNTLADPAYAIGDRIHLHWPARASLVLADDGDGTG